jgi:hypothetical protein
MPFACFISLFKSSLCLKDKIDLKKDIKISISKYLYDMNGNIINEINIEQILIVANNKKIEKFITILEKSFEYPVKFLPHYIIEILEDNNIIYSILINKRFLKIDQRPYKSIFNLEKIVEREIMVISEELN